MPASAAGSAEMIRNGSSHDWKLTTMSRYTSRMDSGQAAEQADVGASHGLALPAQDEVRAARQLLLVLVDDLLHRARHSAQVGAFDVGENVEHRLHVVVADRAQFRAGLEWSARLPSTCTVRGRAGRRVSPTAFVLESRPAYSAAPWRERVTGRLFSAAIESSLYCGVCVAML